MDQQVDLTLEDSEGNELDLDGFKYTRFGYIVEDRFCDTLIGIATKLQEAELMPPRWRMLPPEEFVEKYGAGPRWSATKSYHLFLNNGRPIFRIWTNTRADFVWIDVDDITAHTLGAYVKVRDIPQGNLKKCKPHTKRIKATNIDHVVHLITVVRHIYGLGN